MELGNAWSAFGYGLLSAVSLPLGAVIGLWLNPSKKWTSSLMSFGAGALLAALTLELVHKSLQMAGFPPLGAGCVAGALLFMFLNSLLDGQGGFLRKLSTTVGYLKEVKLKRAETVLDQMGRIEIFQHLPPEEMQAIIPMLQAVSIRAGTSIFKRGDVGDRLYLIEKGEVEVSQGERDGDTQIAVLAQGAAFGEMALIHDKPRTASVRAKSDLKAWVLDKSDFNIFLESSPELRKAVTLLDEKRSKELHEINKDYKRQAAQEWSDAAKKHIQGAAMNPDQKEIKDAHAEHGGAAMAIWLGILLDGIPESLVIGATMIGKSSVSMSLIVGVFLANFPEALSSAVGMKRQKYSFGKILWMWSSLMILTGVGAFVGNLTFGGLNPSLFVFIEGLAAGAMLAMIAETMLPEAAEQGGPANGLMTVLGFLAAIFVGTLGGGH